MKQSQMFVPLDLYHNFIWVVINWVKSNKWAILWENVWVFPVKSLCYKLLFLHVWLHVVRSDHSCKPLSSSGRHISILHGNGCVSELVFSNLSDLETWRLELFVGMGLNIEWCEERSIWPGQEHHQTWWQKHHLFWTVNHLTRMRAWYCLADSSE